MSNAAPLQAIPTTPAAWVPFGLEEISGNRPILPVDLNGHSYRMMVHANAGFYLQINHDTAAMADVHIEKHTGAYGIERSGHVSVLGRDEGVLPSLKIGNRCWSDVPVSVFETPSQGVGMLGLRWITSNRVIVDFITKTLAIAPTDATRASLERRMQREGYTAIPMLHQETSGRYTVAVTIQGVTRDMVVSMVAGLVIDKAFAQAANVDSSRLVDQAGGPNGAIEKIYAVAKPVQLNIGEWRSALDEQGTIVDVYAYENRSRPNEPSQAEGGALGSDFLISHRAVIDFGSRTLYLK